MLASDRVDLLEPGLSSTSEPLDSDLLRSLLEAPMLDKLEDDPLKLEVEPLILLAPRFTSFLSTWMVLGLGFLRPPGLGLILGTGLAETGSGNLLPEVVFSWPTPLPKN